MRRVDCVVIGAGHNGLIAATRVLDEGRSVLVIEQAETAGGMTGVHAAFPGASDVVMAPRGASDTSLLRDDVSELIGFPGADGGGPVMVDAPVVAFAPEDRRGPALALYPDVAQTAAAIARHHQRDAARWPDFVHWVGERCGELEPLLRAGGPGAEIDRWQATGRLAQAPALLRALSMPLASLLGEWFESPRLQGMLTMRALLGTRTGPFSPGSSYPFFYRSWGTSARGLAPVRRPAGGMADFVAGLVAAVERRGGRIALASRVDRIVLGDGRVRGVEVRPLGAPPDSPAQFVETQSVLASTDPFMTLERLVGDRYLPIDVGRRLRATKPHGTVVRLDLLLRARPRFRGQSSSSELTGSIVIAGTTTDLELAAIDARRGRESKTLDGTATVEKVAAPGPHDRYLLSYVAQHVPHDAEVDARQVVGRLLKRLEESAPGVVDLIEHRRLHLPGEWQDTWGVSGGHIDHGEVVLERSFVLRPWRGAGHFSSPFEGLYFCGAGVHPGGGVTGLPGLGGAEALLNEPR